MRAYPSRVLAAALATAALLGTLGATSATAAPVSVPSLDWQDCGGGFECATAVVPRDHDRPRGATFALPLIRKPASDRAHRIGSLFLNPGGPGGSGVELVRTAPPPVFDLFSRFDVVGFDPRGIGGSVPAVDCGPSIEDNAGVNKHFVPPHEIDVKAELRTARADVSRCIANNPGVLEYVGTANVARDLDLLRRAVGDARLTYIGVSYGGVIGATYASLFPGRARALLLDSPVDPDQWTNRPFEHRMLQNAGFEDSLDRFFMACAAQPDVCGLGEGNPEDAFDALVARMNATPLPAPDATHPDPVRGDDLLGVAGDAMYSIHIWPALAAGLAGAADGDASVLRDLIDAFAGRRPDGTYPPTGRYFAVTAQDFRLERDVAAYLADAVRQYGMFPHTWAYAFGQNFRYAVYPLKQNDVFRGPFTNPASAAPILVIGGTHDPATPYDMARRLVRQLGNARLLTYESDGHGAATDLNPCILQAVVAYVNDLTLPDAGARCTQGVEPFPGAAATAAPRAAPRWPLGAR
jgi:pimeloyl-ACP methyl ester carboxylesterase